jgi:predicted amino acid-binding ACT domain protein
MRDYTAYRSLWSLPRGKTIVEDHLQVHEILGTVPLDVEVFLLKLLIQTLEISLNVLDGLLDLIVVVRFIAESTDRHQQKYRHNDGQQSHKHKFLVRKRPERQ